MSNGDLVLEMQGIEQGIEQDLVVAIGQLTAVAIIHHETMIVRSLSRTAVHDRTARIDRDVSLARDVATFPECRSAFASCLDGCQLPYYRQQPLLVGPPDPTPAELDRNLGLVHLLQPKSTNCGTGQGGSRDPCVHTLWLRKEDLRIPSLASVACIGPL